MAEPNFQLSGINFEVIAPRSVSRAIWHDLQNLGERAFEEALPDRSSTEVERLFHHDDPATFREARLNPLVDVRAGRLREGQFAKPLVALAYRPDGMPIGYAYSADNTSGGSRLERILKMRTPPVVPVPKIGGKRYVWFREIAIDPEFQHRGIAHALGYLSLEKRRPKQPVTAYVWEETVGIMGLLRSVGFSPNPSQPEPAKPFGETSRAAQMYRMAAPSALLVMSRILDLPGAKDALARTKTT